MRVSPTNYCESIEKAACTFLLVQLALAVLGLLKLSIVLENGSVLDEPHLAHQPVTMDRAPIDRETGVMMNDASFVRAPTILHACAHAGAVVRAVVAKDKLRQLVGIGLAGGCISAEQDGVPVYSAELSIHVLRRGVELLRTERPDVLYLSTSDFIQHAHAPGTAAANAFYAAVDEQLAMLDDFDVNLVITADHGMYAKSDTAGRPRIVFLQELCDVWCGPLSATVILRHHDLLQLGRVRVIITCGSTYQNAVTVPVTVICLVRSTGHS